MRNAELPMVRGRPARIVTFPRSEATEILIHDAGGTPALHRSNAESGTRNAELPMVRGPPARFVTFPRREAPEILMHEAGRRPAHH
jgi:hypothetical protein